MIYIVEDDAEIRELEVYALKSSGFESKSFDSGKNLDEEIKVQVPDLFILDIMLPGEDGLSILKRLRAQENTKNVPIIMLTAKSSELDKVKGLDLGADDYIAKPFGILEFVSRVRALLRRSGNMKSEESVKITLGEIVLDSGTREVSVSGNSVELTYLSIRGNRFWKRSGASTSRWIRARLTCTSKLCDKSWVNRAQLSKPYAMSVTRLNERQNPI